MKHLFTLKRRLLGLLSLTALFVLISALPAKADYLRTYTYYTSYTDPTHYTTSTLDASYATLAAAVNATAPSAGHGTIGWTYTNYIVANGSINDGSTVSASDYTVVIDANASVELHP